MHAPHCMHSGLCCLPECMQCIRRSDTHSHTGTYGCTHTCIYMAGHIHAYIRAIHAEGIVLLFPLIHACIRLSLFVRGGRAAPTYIRASIRTRISMASFLYFLRCLDEPHACMLYCIRCLRLLIGRRCHSRAKCWSHIVQCAFRVGRALAHNFHMLAHFQNAGTSVEPHRLRLATSFVFAILS